MLSAVCCLTAGCLWRLCSILARSNLILSVCCDFLSRGSQSQVSVGPTHLPSTRAGSGELTDTFMVADLMELCLYCIALCNLYWSDTTGHCWTVTSLPRPPVQSLPSCQAVKT